ncbi:hypothetical protein F4861DRAFT_537500 [Xylaria intraflava]|nr:hypothetical protein F4861DRAFT_537500 [Xylaria intraflava]
MGLKQANPSASAPFVVLAVLAFFLLHGILIADGGMLALLKNIVYGSFSDGSPRYPVNTGNSVLDLMLAQCVSFWTPVVSKSTASLLISSTLCASLQTVAVWATIEGLRGGKKHAMLHLAPLTIFFWQYVGTSIVLPLYTIVELRHHFGDGASESSKSRNNMALPYAAAQALIPSAVIALVHPFLTIHYTPAGTTDAQLQTFVANYHLAGPIYYILIAAAAYTLTNRGTDTTPRPRDADFWWVRATYVSAGAFSLLIHLDVLRRIAGSREAGVSFVGVFLPSAEIGLPGAAATQYVKEHLYFLQWDWVILVLTVALWLARTTTALDALRSKRTEEDLHGMARSVGLLLAYSLACMLFGFGAVGSAVLYYREEALRADTVGQEDMNADEKSTPSDAVSTASTATPSS